MGPVQSIKTCFRKYASFKGRAIRSEFWWFYLFSVVVQMVLYGLGGAISPNLLIVAMVAGLALVIPSLAVGCRRLHDRNMSGWMQLILIIPLGFIVLMVLWALKGTEGENNYGPEP